MSSAKKLYLLSSLFLALVILSGVGCRAVIRRDSNNTGSGPMSIAHSGLERTFYLHIPPTYDGTRPMPLVIALHGGGGNGKRMNEFVGGLNTLADQEGFFVVYPEGVDRHWNDGREVHKDSPTGDVDDVGFLSALIDHIAEDFNIDPERVYATGISNGGMMSFRLACELPEKIAAIAPVAIGLSEKLSAHCSPSQPVSVLVINGTEDPLVPWQGGEIEFGRQKRGKVLSASDTIRFWVTQNHCATPPIITWEPDSDPEDGTRVRREVYEQCDDGTEVVLYVIEGGGHTWPGGKQYLPKRIVGRVSRDLDANEVIWRFFERHAE